MKHSRAKLQSMAGRPRPPIVILGVPFDNVTKADALEQIEGMVRSRKPHYLVTPNVDFLVQARQDIELRRILFEAHLVLCDGTPLVWASKLLGNALPERVAGADIVPLLIAVAEQNGYRLFLLGATPESSRRAVSRLQMNHPKLVIAGHYSPPFNQLLDMDHEEIVRRIRDAKPDVLLVSLGCPKQEKWIAMHYRTLGVPVTIGVGATIDFLAGQVRRAPVWMQRSGTEWIFRLAQEPRRLFRRYVTDLWAFSGSIWLQWWRLKARSPWPRLADTSSFSELRPSAATTCAPHNEAAWQLLRLPARLDLAVVCDRGQQIEQQVAATRHCLLDASGVNFIDSTGVGFLIKLQKKVRAAGRELILINPTAGVRRALAVLRLDQFFRTAPDVDSAGELIQSWTTEQAAAVSISRGGGESILAWQGEITAANVEQLWEQLHPLLPGISGKWTIDLAAVRFIDSSGLGLMVRIKKLGQQQQQTVEFINLQPAVRNVVRIARLEEFLLRPQLNLGPLQPLNPLDCPKELTGTVPSAPCAVKI